MSEALKIGAYICRGCGLADRLDTNHLAEIAKTEGNAALVRQHKYLCHTDGVAMIQNDIDNEDVTHVLVGACSRRAKYTSFNFAAVAVARTNLREGVIWTQPDDSEMQDLTQEMADDYIRMGCAELKSMQQPEQNTCETSNRRILVVGGGISGMTAALNAAKAGYQVLMVEKSGKLGGWTSQLHKRLPWREPYTEPQDSGVNELAQQLEHNPHITLYLNSVVHKTSGSPGQFSITISTESGPIQTENVGAIIQASGFHSYDASQLPHYSYGKAVDVVDLAAIEKMAIKADGSAILRPSDGNPVTHVVFVLCAGQRSDKAGHLPYCSGYCCNVSIKQAMYFKDQNPKIDTHIIYTDLRVPGNGEDFYRSAQRKGVTFTKGWVFEVKQDDNQLTLNFHDKILDQKATLYPDLVVLATGQVPNSGINIEALTATTGDETDSSQHNDSNSAKVSLASILNLDYRQGPDLPQLKHGLCDSHFICFPYETRRTGIYACGPVRRPMDVTQAIDDATGAAMKAIQAVESAANGRAMHPRSGDLSLPQFRKSGCTQCKRCTVECPFGAIDEDEEGFPKFNASRCRRCGTCMGACPVRVISFENYSIDTVGQQIKAVDMPDEFDEKPRILVLACENDAYPALDMAAHNRVEYCAFVRIIPVRCLGSVNLIWVTDALSKGFDGVMLMGCKKGVDYQCHFVKGSDLAHVRLSKVDDTLSQLQLESERVVVHEVEITDIHRAPRLINEYAAKIGELGMNPFKGF